MSNIKKVVVIGPESTGKTTLCEKLAAHYKTGWVTEYAREFLGLNGKAYNADDLLTIAEGQLKNEAYATFNMEHSKAPTKFLFIDTDLYVIKIWSEFVFNSCANSILTQIASRQYDLYLLCNTDVPWVNDALREYPDKQRREHLFHMYKDAMINQSAPWVEINGNYEQRLNRAIDAVNNIL
ncbi:MAG: ATP-binding protein [Ferruginibacter sp.]|nr:ATP-binding protein [Ferruginibacter sp.]